MTSEKPASVWREFIDALRLLTPSERYSAAFYAVASIVAGLLDTVALASTMPFIALLVDTKSALGNRHIGEIYKLFGEPAESSFVVWVGGFCLMLVLGSGLLSAWLQRRTNRFVASCQARLAQEVMNALVHAPYVWFLGVNTQVVSHVFQRDVFLWARELVYKLLSMTRDITLIVMPLALVVIITPVIGVLTLAGIAVLVLGVVLFSRPRITMLTHVKHEADARALALAGQALTGIKDVAISGRQSEFVNSFARTYRTYTWANAEMQNQHQLPNKAILLLGQVGLLSVAIVLWLAGSDRGTLAAQLSLLVLVTSRIVPAANRLSTAFTTFFGVFPAVRGIQKTLYEIRHAGDRKLDEKQALSIPRPWRQITFEDVKFVYPNSADPAVGNVSLEIEGGKTYGIVGASGAGKSTVADLLMGLVVPAAGRICVDGTPINSATVRSWQSRIGYVPQAPFVLDDTLAANVAFGMPPAKRDAARLADAIEAANLADLVAELPEGLDTNLGDRGLRLSGGQRQRVAIARALYDDCDLLVLDEATAALDTVSERAVQDAISGLKGKMTTVAIAHRLSTVRDCDRIFVFDQGRLVAEGRWNELLADSPLFRKMVESGNDRELAA